MKQAPEERIVGILAYIIAVAAVCSVIFWAAGGVIHVGVVWKFLSLLLLLLGVYWHRSTYARYAILQSLSLSLGAYLIPVPALALRVLTYLGAVGDGAMPIVLHPSNPAYVPLPYEMVALWAGVGTFGLVLTSLGAEAAKRAFVGRILDFPSLARYYPYNPEEEPL